jgi:F-box-like
MELHSGKQLLPIPYVTLPPELLRMIFKACADPPSPELGVRYWYDASNMRWIAITHVCRYWRSVALGYSDLWKRLYFFNPDVTEEMIHRSKGANLEVRINAKFRVHRRTAESDFITMLLPELHRVSVLHLIYPDLLQSLVDGFVSAAPKLEYLFLATPDSKCPFHIPDTIFSRETPALRSLVLYKCIFTSPSPSSGTMTSPDSPIGNIPSTISQIVSFLRGAPMLHTLILKEVLPYEDTDYAYPNLVLPKLSQLRLTSSVASCTNFLEHIIFPVTTDTTVTCDNPSQDDDYGRLFRTFLSVMGNSKTNFVISALKLEVRSSKYSHLISVLCMVTHSHQPVPTIVTFEFFTGVYDNELFRDILNTASVTLPLTNAHKLEIAGDGHCWRGISFISLPNIRTIHFKTYNLPLSMVRAVLADNEHSHQLRSLRRLQLSNVKFLNEGISTLVDGLKRRLLSGLPIEHIRLDKCFNLKTADVMRMKEFVQDVEWDGY